MIPISIWTAVLKLANNNGDNCALYIIDSSGVTLVSGHVPEGITITKSGTWTTVSNNTGKEDIVYITILR